MGIFQKKKKKYKSGEILATECMTRNFAKVLYQPSRIDQHYPSWAEFQAAQNIKTN